MPPRMFLCPSCESHVKEHETACPHCGAAFESAPKKSRTVAMVLLGLATVAAPAACDSEVETSDDDSTQSQNATTSMMMQSTTQDSIVSAYGVGGFSSTGGFGGESGGSGGDGGDGGDLGGAGGAGGN